MKSFTFTIPARVGCDCKLIFTVTPGENLEEQGKIRGVWITEIEERPCEDHGEILHDAFSPDAGSHARP